MIRISECDNEVIGVTISDKEISIVDCHDDHILAECSLEDLQNESGVDFPQKLSIQLHSTDGLGTYLFHEVHIISVEGETCIDFISHQPNKYWEGRWGLSTFLDAIRKQIEFQMFFKVEEIELEDDWKRLTLRCKASSQCSLRQSILDSALKIKQLIKETEISLSGITWKKEFETDESIFCTELLLPLFRRMGFLSVRYTHGTKEYGKDFTFSELTPFGNMRHFGLQAKAGKVSGKVNSAIDELIGQLEDAFSMPYHDLSSNEPRYISSFIFAISGTFTENAKEKIIQKIPKGVLGSVLFLDKESLQELVQKFWIS